MLHLSDRASRIGKLERKLAAYAVAGGAFAAAAAGEAQADLITTQIDQTITATNDGESYTLDVGGQDIVTFSATMSDGTASIAVTLTPGGDFVTDDFMGNLEYTTASNLVPGFVVSASDDFGSLLFPTKNMAAYGMTNSGEFANVSNGYLGVEFLDPNTPTQTDYGYVLVSSTGDATPSGSLTITSLTYDDSGNPVTIPDSISAVPEPSALAMLASGFVATGAYLALRRRKTA